MDLSTVKGGNDFLIQMYKDNNPDVPVETTGTEGQPSIDNNVVDNALEPSQTNGQGSDAAPALDNGQVEQSSDANQIDNDLITDWDPVAQPKVEPTTTYDFKSLGKALDLEDVDSEQKLIEHYKSVVSKTKELEKISADFTSAPEPLKEALEIAKKGGDYLEYLGISTVDYDSFDDRSLFEESLINLGLFSDGKGGVDEEALAEYVDGLPEKAISIEAAKVRAQAKQAQALQKQTIVQKAEEQRIEAVRKLRSALDGLDAVGPFKLTESHKKAMFDDMSSGQIMKVLFFNEKGQFDYKKAAEIYFKQKYEARINQLLHDSIKKQTTKAIANDLKNVDLTTQGRLTTPTSSNQPVDPLDAWMARLQSGK